MTAPRGSPFVDYDSVAQRYEMGRSLPGDALDRWRDAALGLVEGQPQVVLDLGAGTGIFSPAWRRWTGARVVALEPSEAMIGRGRLAEDSGVEYVQAVAENVPLSDRQVDVIWVSTAIHHFVDLADAVAEMARVLRPDGRVLVRTFLPDHTIWTAFTLFPRAAQLKALERLPSSEQLSERFTESGLELVGSADVVERTRTFTETARWVEHMRDSDTMLTAMTDAEVAAGVRALRARATEADVLSLSLLAFARR